MVLSMTYFSEIIFILASYTIGCISMGYYLVRFKVGSDVRKAGSKSAGARNVARIAGVKWGVIVFFSDLAKGALVVALAIHIGLATWTPVLAMLAVVIGNIWPIQLGFRGGKGIATTLGALLVLSWQLTSGLILAAAILYLLTKRFTLSGLLAVTLAPVFALATEHSAITTIGISVLTVIILVAHRSNIGVIVSTISRNANRRKTNLDE